MLLRMCQSLFSPPPSSQMVTLVLPAAATALKRGQIPIDSLVNVLFNCTPEKAEKLTCTKAQPTGTQSILVSPFLAYSVLFLAYETPMGELVSWFGRGYDSWFLKNSKVAPIGGARGQTLWAALFSLSI